MSLAIRTSNSDASFDWSEIFTVWKEFALFFVAFLIHNHLLAPLLVYKQRRLLYFGLVIAIVAVFQLYQSAHRPVFRERGPRPERFEKMKDGERPPLPPDFEEGDFKDRGPGADHGPGVDREHPIPTVPVPSSTSGPPSCSASTISSPSSSSSSCSA